MNYTQQQFNEMAFFHQEGARLTQDEIYSDENGKYFHDCNGDRYDAFYDLNVLMPLFWKYWGKHDSTPWLTWIAVKPYDDREKQNIVVESNDPIQAIRDCLWQIWSEGNTNE